MLPKITIFTQAYNTENYIVKCIESVLSQTFTNFEYIIVDNGSTDKTKEIIAEYAKKDSRIRAFRFEENRRGFWPDFVKEMANGEYFSSLDSDDWIEPTFLEVLINMAEKENLDIVTGGTCFHFVEGNGIGYRKSDAVVLVDDNTILEHFGFIYQFLRTVWGKIFRMSVVKDTDYSDFYNIAKTGYGGDTAFCLDALRHAKKIGASDKVLHHYLVRPQSTSYGFNPNRSLSDILIFRKAEAYLLQFGKISNENYFFLFAIYVNAIIDTINVILKTDLGTYEKLCEIEKVLKEQLTQQGLRIINSDNRLKAFKKSILELIIDAEKSNSDNKQILDMAYSNICLLNIYISQYVNKENLVLHLRNSDFLMHAINLSSDEMLKKAISSLDDEVLSNSIWAALVGILNKNVLLSWIDNKAFAMRYSDILIEVYNNKYAEAMDKIADALNTQDEIPFEEMLLFMCLNVSAILEDGSMFIYTKKLQTQLFIRQNRFNEAAASLNDLLEMCPDDDDVMQLKQWLEEENA